MSAPRRHTQPKLRRVLLAAVLLPSLYACAGESLAPDPVVDETSRALPDGFVACGENRPEMCTREYRPVCALRDTGVRCVTAPCEEATEWVTRPNACEACADTEVIGHRPGDCAADGMPRREALDL